MPFNYSRIASVKIIRDEDPINPRENTEPLGLLACWHKRKVLGDVQPKESMDEWLKPYKDAGAVILPVYMMDHSGITLRTEPQAFQAADPARFDWGLLGFIVSSKLDHDEHEAVADILKSEVELYNSYLNGSCWCVVMEDDSGEEDSCWGFIGDDLDRTGIKEHVPGPAHYLLKEAWDARYSSSF